MRKFYLIVLAVIGLQITSFSQRNCGSMSHLNDLMISNPRGAEQMQKIEAHTNKFVNTHNAKAASGVVTIPVVVHVVYGNSSQNISDVQVQSQIQVLNEDFRRLNADKSNTPSVFSSIASDIEIEFCLASIDPNGNPTSGITRTSTSTSSFSTNDGVKSSSSGGKNAWATSDYLNLWVCNMSGSTLGYAQFPGSGSASTDGVVISYKYFGRGGSAISPFNKGRTATHEVGHWLNLRHIWGDGGCSYDDYVSDTPLAGNEHYGCPSWPQTTCSSNDMYMNYMDYVDDNCMNMFSAGQKSRMRALFNTGGYRESILSSNGCGGTPTVGYCTTNGQDASYEWIANVNFASINKTTGTNGGYADFTSTSTNVQQGQTYALSLTPGFKTDPYDEYWKIWIDYNQDQDFDDAGELAFDAGSMSQTTVNGNISIPTSAATGQTRMRVSMKYNGAQTACETFQYGEIEDYTVNITAASQPCNVPSGLSSSSITSSSAVVSWPNVTNAVNYTLQYKKSTSSTWSNATSTTLSGLSSSTTYNWRVKTNCSSNNSAYSSTQSFSTLAIACNTPTSLSSSSVTINSATISWNGASGASSYIVGYRKSGTSTWTNSTISTTSKNLTGLSASTTYEFRAKTNCSSNTSSYTSTKTFTTQDDVPVSTGYCSSKGGDASYEWVANVSIGSINKSTGTNGGYADFTSTATNLEKGSSNPISLSPGFKTDPYNEYWKIWIDYNQDGDFSDAGELAFDAGSMSQTTVTGTLIVPSNVLTGSTRMRVSMKYNAAQTVCESFQYGEVEDYTVNITEVITAPVTYCDSKGSNSSYEWIANVSVGNINNSTGNNGGYEDFTSISTNLVGGNSYNVSLTPGFQGSTYNEYWKIYIDLNKDGDFNDSGELVFDAGTMSKTTVTGSMTIPGGYSGTTRMRVSMKYNASQTPCETFSYGEVEDYTVTISSGGSRLAKETENEEEFTVSIYPNPANYFANIKLTDFSSGLASIKMIDMKGVVFYSEKVNVSTFGGIELNDIPAGIYSIIISDDNNRYKQQKLVVTK